MAIRTANTNGQHPRMDADTLDSSVQVLDASIGIVERK